MGAVESSGLTIAEHDHLMSTLTLSQANSISSLNSELAIIAGLVQRNQRITDCVYDGNGNLIQSTLSIYSSAQDAELEDTPIKQFRMDAIYNNNELTDYLMKEL